MKQYKILLVEDDAINSLALFSALDEVFSVKAVNNGASAVAQSQLENFDAILMDINLKKGKNGIEAAEEIRKDVRYHNTPIIAMTAYTKNHDESEFIELGFSHYISKPFSSKKMINMLHEIFNGSKDDQHA